MQTNPAPLSLIVDLVSVTAESRHIDKTSYNVNEAKVGDKIWYAQMRCIVTRVYKLDGANAIEVDDGWRLISNITGLDPRVGVSTKADQRWMNKLYSSAMSFDGGEAKVSRSSSPMRPRLG